MNSVYVPLLAVLFASMFSAAQESSLSKQERKALQREADQTSAEVMEFKQQGRWGEALDLCWVLYGMEVELVGERAWDVGGTHQSLADSLEHLGKLEEAREHLEMVVDIAADYPDQRWWQIKASGFLEDFDLRREASAADLERLFAAEATNATILQLNNNALWDKALPLIQEQLAAREAVYGPEHHRCALALHGLGLVSTKKRDFSRAEDYFERALSMREKTLGEENPLYGESLNNLAVLWTATGQHLKALPLLEAAVRIAEKTRGTDSSEFRLVLGSLQSCYYNCQDMEAAKDVAELRLQLFQARYAEDDRRCVEPMNDLGRVLVALGRYDEAGLWLERALAILRQRRKPNTGDLLQTLANLAAVRDDLGDLPRSRELLVEAIELGEAAYGKDHANYALLLNNLAALEMQLGDRARAVKLLRRVVEIARKDLGMDSMLYFGALNNLAIIVGGDEAFQLAAEARSVFRGNNETDSALYAVALSNQLVMYCDHGRFEEALELGLEAERIARSQPGEMHVRFVKLFANLGILHVQSGDLDRGHAYLDEALQLAERELDPRHPDRATCLHQLAGLAHLRGEHDLAAELYGLALSAFRGNLELVAAAQSERQQLSILNTTRAVLDTYLSSARSSKVPAADLYGEVLAWKGSVFARQARQRLQLGLPELAPVFAELQEVTDQYASLALTDATELGDDYRERLGELVQQREGLERRIAGKAGGLQPPAVPSPRELRESLPAGVALVDFLIYARYETVAVAPGTLPEVLCTPYLIAFVLRRGAEIAQVDLGPYGLIAAAIEAWRRELLAMDHVSRGAGEQLRALVWDPLVEFLNGSDLVLLSPDGDLARMPFAALPGSQPQGYLIEDVALGLVAAPHMIPRLLEEEPRSGLISLLTVGGVEFDAVPSTATTGAKGTAGSDRKRDVGDASVSNPIWRGPAGRSSLSKMWPFPLLTGSRSEADAVARVFEGDEGAGAIHQLDGAEATETALRGLISGSRFVHLATHGFFAGGAAGSSNGEAARRPLLSFDFDSRLEISGAHPGLFSGIVLAGANTRRGAAGDDGLLTAIEMATLDLRGVELLTLSACETGLGTTAGGESLLGLQRAAQISGARSVLASLWKVQDSAAADWMTRFYTNLWRKGMSRLEAMREVQLAQIRQREDPRLWAAWVLSGDWR